VDRTQAGVVDTGARDGNGQGTQAIDGEARPGAPAPGTALAVDIEEPDRPDYVRRPSDLLRIVIGVVVLLFGLLLVTFAPDSVTSFQRSVFAFFNDLGDTAHTVIRDIVGVFDNTVIFAALILLLFLRRWRAAGYLVLANILGSNLGELIARGIHHLDPASFDATANSAYGPLSERFSDSATMCGVVAVVTVMLPWMNRTWRRIAWTGLLLTAFARLVASAALPAALFFECALGWVVGSAILLAFGAPNPHATAAAIAEALTNAGLPLARLKAAAVDARASVPYFVETVDGERLFVKVLGAGQRDADLLFRLYRWVRFRDTGDEKPFASVRRSVEHEMLLGLAARDIGTRTPRVRTVADVDAPGGAVLLASDRIDGHSLDECDVEVVTDTVLRDLWEQVRILRDHKIAHRDLRLANVFLDDDGRTWIIDFGFGAIAAGDHACDDDVAGLLASTALTVGPERAVAVAVDVMGRERLGSALPRLQPQALSGSTQSELKKAENKDLLAELRQRAQDAAGVDEVQLERLERIRARTIFTALALGAAIFFLYPQLANIDTLWGQVQHAHLAWALVVVLCSFVTYIGATLSIMGAVPNRLRPIGTFNTQVASSFVNRITPANAGGYAVNVRYLQKSGVETPVALTGVALNSVAGLIVHVALIFVFLAWAGSGNGTKVHMPSTVVFVYIAIVLGIVGAVTTVLPAGRHVMRRHLWPALLRGVYGIGNVARKPTKLVLLLGGSTIVTLSYMVGLWASVKAFDGNLSFADIGLTYLTASAVASAAPTPGGLGAAEAAYAAGLSLLGLDKGVALAAVFLFRACTFWLPIIPGWLLFRAEQRRGEL
jgi:undecaprenyl-diphosphatase